MQHDLHRTTLRVMSALLLLCCFHSSLAHHSFAMFDRTKTVTITGTVKTIEWTNPHAWVWVTVPNANGGTDDWGMETAGPSMLNRLGIKRSLFKPGEKITIELHPMADGRKGGELSKATLADGQVIDMMKQVGIYSSGGQPGQTSDSARPKNE